MQAPTEKNDRVIELVSLGLVLYDCIFRGPLQMFIIITLKRQKKKNPNLRKKWPAPPLQLENPELQSNN
jgi:hypothetical protein